MTGKERLLKCQERLIAQGVKDVKFTPGEKFHTLSLDEACHAAADWLEAILDKKYVEAEPINDSIGLRDKCESCKGTGICACDYCMSKERFDRPCEDCNGTGFKDGEHRQI